MSMVRGTKLYFEDILSSIKKIERYIKNVSLLTFQKDEKTIDAVVRNLEIIGEAANNIPEKVKAESKDIPWQQIIGMRNKVIHEYFGVDIDMLWQTLIADIPQLLKQIKALKKNKLSY